MTTDRPCPVRLSCIIPAFDEGPRIGAVLDVVVGHPMIDEVIVIDDGSTDDTAEVVAGRADVRLVRLKVNVGKTRALAAGIAQAQGRWLLLVDSDLVGLGRDDLTALITPVLDDMADMSVSLRHNAPRLWHWIGLDYISGERVLRRDRIATRLSELHDLPRFGFEVWLNRICVETAARLAVVAWPGVDSPTKSRKFGLVRGTLADARMMLDLRRSAGALQLIRQIGQMRRLRTRHLHE